MNKSTRHNVEFKYKKFAELTSLTLETGATFKNKNKY